MKRIFPMLYLILNITFSASAQDLNNASSDRRLMMEILNERKQKFSSYTESLDDRTGIFGMKTKKDIERSRKILIDIVKLDNRLISVLNRRLDYKDFEKTELSYNTVDQSRKIEELSRNFTLADNRMKKLGSDLEQAENEVRKRNMIITFLVILVSVLLLREIIRSRHKIHRIVTGK